MDIGMTNFESAVMKIAIIILIITIFGVPIYGKVFEEHFEPKIEYGIVRNISTHGHEYKFELMTEEETYYSIISDESKYVFNEGDMVSFSANTLTYGSNAWSMKLSEFGISESGYIKQIGYESNNELIIYQIESDTGIYYYKEPNNKDVKFEIGDEVSFLINVEDVSSMTIWALSLN